MEGVCEAISWYQSNSSSSFVLWGGVWWGEGGNWILYASLPVFKHHGTVN